MRRVLGLPPAQTGGRLFVSPLAALAVAAACAVMPLLMARGDKPPATAPSAPAAPADALANAEAPGPDDLVADNGPYLISPNDLLKVAVTDLTGPGTLTVRTTRVKEKNGRDPLLQHVVTSRGSKEAVIVEAPAFVGDITMPYLGSPIHAEGLTEEQLEQTIGDRYRSENIVQKAQVKVTIIEARGRAFRVEGQVSHPGEFSIAGPDLRLLDALNLSGADLTKLDRIYIVRTLKIDQTPHGLDVHPAGKPEFKAFHLKHANSDSTTRLLLEVFKPSEDAKDKPAPGSPPYGVNAISDARNNSLVVTAPAEAMKVVEQIIREADRPPSIVVSAKALAAGDPKLNVVIHRGDTIVVRGFSRIVKVLYVEGSPRWEYRYIKTALLHHPAVRISFLLTSADPGYEQEASDPDPSIGFAGRVTAFPETAEGLGAYDVILFGDVDSREFTDKQLQLLCDFVRKDGGGFAMIAGRASPRSAFAAPESPACCPSISIASLPTGRTSNSPRASAHC